ncbi:MAG TPA: DUF3108 domain-containing protein [Candidatus Acidoferrum sp.]
MSKKNRVVLIIAVLLVLVGVWYATRRAKELPVETRTSESSTKGTPAGPNVAIAPGVAKEGEVGVGKKPAVAETGLQLRSGESLEYAANISKLNSTIANLKVLVGEQKSLSGKPVWHLQAFAHTENPYRMVFELDDQFDSYSEPSALTSMQYEMHLSERGQKVDSVQRLLSSMKETAPQGMLAARVLPGTRDPLGMLQYLRSVDWNKTPEVRSPIYDGRKLYDVRAVLVNKSEAVSVPAGKYNTSKIEIHVLDNGAEMKDMHFLLYLSNDGTRTPVLMEAVLPIATARVELTKAK